MPTGPAAVAGGAGTLALAAVVVGGAFVYDMGAVRVSVQSKKPDGEHIRLIVPAVAAPIALRFAPKRDLQKAVEEAGPYLPAVKIALEELARCPDGPLVQVTSPREKVNIAKVDDALVIDVDDEGETVHVSVPLKAASVVISQLESLPPPDREEQAKHLAPAESGPAM
ncbi:MAG: hypothetical protein ACE145_11745 [Terriglobia bacterium]